MAWVEGHATNVAAILLTNAANHLITPEHLYKHIDLLKTASYILADANISVDTAEWLLGLLFGINLFFGGWSLVNISLRYKDSQ